MSHLEILNRPDKIIEVKEEANGIVVEFSTNARTSVLSYTHETALHLYKPAAAALERLYLHIHIWGEETFRVILSAEADIKDPYERIPKEYQMLIAEPQKVNYRIEEDEHRISIVTCKIEVSVCKENGCISARYADGVEFFCQQKSEFMAADIYDLAIGICGAQTSCYEALELKQDELIYGLGERFDSLVRNGRTVDFWNKDAVGTTSRRSYVNIPFYLSTKGYGLFLNSSAKTDWQIGTKDLGTVQFSVADAQMDYFIIGGKTPKEILHGYCCLTGFAPLPPIWSFGLWMSRNSYTSWKVVDEIARETRANDIPCDVLHLDTAWFEEDWNCDLKFSKERFPEPEAHIRKYKEDGFRISAWQYNFIPPKENNTHYKEAVEQGYLAKDEEGKPYQLPEECQGNWTRDVIVDFTNPKARKWYGDKIEQLIHMGVAAIKTDFGEGIPEAAIYDSIDGRYVHNFYSLIYNATVFKASKRASGENFVWARSGTAGSQRYPIHWGGDSQCTFEGLAGTLRGALTIGMSGIPFFSHDIGGFIGMPTDELYVRWAQLGLFSSHSRCHGEGDVTYREPWRFSEEACRIFRYYDKLRYSLMPYIYSEAKKCTETGLPMMRALYLEYPEDRNAWNIDDEYMLGDSLLIAPILQPLDKSKIRNIYLPKGIWFDYFTKEKIRSTGMWITQEVKLETMPIFVKEGAVLRYCAADTNLQNGMDEIIKTEVWS